uniref:Uncharacterized protein n=1 Tax=Myoviridae sp. ctdyF5 TaxID=2825144 RepID=A0A8S5U7P6_9CAUD|nr:MAG TPA: Protein of unknown function (DUF678) [Myoviridae sp. ctdyF5]
MLPCCHTCEICHRKILTMMSVLLCRLRPAGGTLVCCALKLKS